MNSPPQILAVIFLAACASVASGQSEDTTYTVTVPVNMSLRPLQGPRSSDHPNTSGNITFTNSSWLAYTASTTGSTVVFKAETPFKVVSNPTLQRDVRLLVKQPFGSGGWVRTVTTSQTDYAAGDLNAEVAVSSSGPGFAFIFVNVTFLTGDLNTLTGGDYELTLVGTITSN
jgi:hypothetical protein